MPTENQHRVYKSMNKYLMDLLIMAIGLIYGMWLWDNTKTILILYFI